MSTRLATCARYLLCSLGLAAVSVVSVIHGVPSMLPALDLKAFLLSLESPNCRVRKEAALRTWRGLVPPEEPRRYISKLQQALDGSRGELRRRLALIVSDAEAEASFWEVRWKSLSFVDRMQGAKSPEEIAKRIEEAKMAYRGIIRNPGESLVMRLNAAGQMAFAIDRFHQFSQEQASPFPPGVLQTWSSELVKLLESPDRTVRLIGALAIGVRPGIPGRTIRKGSIISELITGLRHPEFSLRIRSQIILESLAGRDSCLDPTDTEGEREPEIKAWENWWTVEKRKMGGEKLPER